MKGEWIGEKAFDCKRRTSVILRVIVHYRIYHDVETLRFSNIWQSKRGEKVFNGLYVHTEMKGGSNWTATTLRLEDLGDYACRLTAKTTIQDPDVMGFLPDLEKFGGREPRRVFAGISQLTCWQSHHPSPS